MIHLKNIFSQEKKVYILMGLTLIGLMLRLIGQPEVPYGFHRDEAGIAYSAYSIIKTGRDEWGRLLPLHFKALGDYPPGVYNYLVALTIPFLGLSVMAERLPAILIGTFMIPLSYFFVKRFFKRDKLALITALLVTISPWDIVQSRAGSEALTALFFTLIGFLVYQKVIKNNQIKHWLLMSFFFFLALYSYNATRIVLPLIFGLLVASSWFKLKLKKTHLIYAVGLLIFSLGSVVIDANRLINFQHTSLLTHPINQNSLTVMYHREGAEKLPVMVTRFYTNKYLFIGTNLVRQYFDYFSFGFLFDEAGYHKRYLVPKMGPLLLVLTPFFIWGLISNKLSKNQKLLLIGWMLVAPLPGVITITDIPNLKRAMYLFLPILIFIAEGILQLFKLLPKNRIKILATSILSLLLIWNLGLFLKQYFIHTKYETVQHRSYGYDQVFSKADAIVDNYQKVVMFENVDSPTTYYLFHHQYPPRKYQALAADQKRDIFSNNQSVVKLDGYEFHPGSCLAAEAVEEKVLYIMTAGCLNDGDLNSKVQIIDKVFSTDNSPLFYLVEHINEAED